MKIFYLSLAAIVVMMSCKKDPATSSGTSAIRYESDNYVDIMTNFSPVVNTASVEVENANPWQDILGAVMNDASQTTMDGKAVAVSDLEISNVRASNIEFYSGYDIDQLEEYLQGGTVNLKYLDASSNLVSLTLGTFGSINASTHKVIFNSNGTDLTSFLKNKPDFLAFELQFNDMPSGSIDIKYSIAFDYNYSYGTSKVK